MLPLPEWILCGFTAGVLLGAFMNPMRVVNLAMGMAVISFVCMFLWPEAFDGRGVETFGGIIMAIPAWGTALAVGATASYPAVRTLRKRGYLRWRKRARFMQHPDD